MKKIERLAQWVILFYTKIGDMDGLDGLPTRDR